MNTLDTIRSEIQLETLEALARHLDRLPVMPSFHQGVLDLIEDFKDHEVIKDV